MSVWDNVGCHVHLGGARVSVGVQEGQGTALVSRKDQTARAEELGCSWAVTCRPRLSDLDGGKVTQGPLRPHTCTISQLLQFTAKGSLAT